MFDLKDLVQEITRCIRNGHVNYQASKELARARKKVVILEERLKSRLESLVKSPAYREYIQDHVVSIRDGRYVIPVKKEYRKNIEGHVLDQSSSGATVYIEPADVKKIQNELNLVKVEEEIEVQKILSYLTGMVESYQREISINIETIIHYDFVFAKAKYSKSIDGHFVELNVQNYLNIKEAKHPLVGENAVPLNFNLGGEYTALIITGPNTGGKTVAIKTVGLLTLMVQSGLHVPVGEGSEFAVFEDLLVDIGDGQSIEHSLSTFSSHICNIIQILEESKPQTLVILDELGAGTDPGEGMGLAISIIDEIYTKGASILATTHFSEIKDFANSRDGFENGSMEFDLETLKPCYSLLIGKPGESQAFSIALRLGMNPKIIEKAHEITYKETKEYRSLLPSASLNHQQKLRNEAYQTDTQRDEKKPPTEATKKKQPKVESLYKIGDRVFVSSLKTAGIVCELENHKGELGIMIKQKKVKVNKKRLTLHIDSKELYPENYDFSIVLESKENRKKDALMKRKYTEGLKIEHPSED
jgi:DNA mismatch repair protein MutS2